MTVKDWIEYELFVGIKPEDIDLSKCPVPTLLPQNEVPYFLFLLTKTQLVVSGFGDIIALDYLAVLGIIDLYEDIVVDKQICFEKIKYLSDLDIEHMNKKAEQARKTAKGK